MRVSSGQLKQLLELDASRPNVGNKMQTFLRDLQQCNPKDQTSKKSRQKGELKLIVDLDTNPFIPEGWKVKEHQKGGQFEWNATKVKLHLSINQQNGQVIKGHNLRKEIESQKPFNANLLDSLFANKKLIPEEWKGKYIYFWGTIYRLSGCGLFVRCLFWLDGRWDWAWSYLGNNWRSDDPAAVPAS